MICIKCKSDRIISINGKTSDCFNAQYKTIDYDGYVPCEHRHWWWRRLY